MTVQKAGRLLRANGERHLKAPEEMARLFGSCPEAVGESAKLPARIRFRLDDLRYEYPHAPVPPGWHPFTSPTQHVQTTAGAPSKYTLPPNRRQPHRHKSAPYRARTPDSTSVRTRK